MSGRQVIYGASDDLIELAGDVAEEFTAHSGSAGIWDGYVAVDGCLVKYRLDEVWEFRVIAVADGVFAVVVDARGEDAEPRNDEDGCPGYSEKVVISRPEKFTWVLHGTDAVAHRG